MRTPPETGTPLTPFPMAPKSCCSAGPNPPCSKDACQTPPPVHPPVDSSVAWVGAMRETPAGPVPVVKTRLDRRDRLGAAAVRMGIGRHRHTVPPGLYAAGTPTPASPVLVSANYKLSFDTLRRHLNGLDAWILVLETFGINVWCAAGKGTFGHAEVIRRVAATRLAGVVAHRELILPQLAAPGVDGRAVRRGCGFTVHWGPVRAEDIPCYLAASGRIAPGMRRVTFTLKERLVLIPVELGMLLKPALFVLLGVFLLSGIGAELFSPARAWPRSGMMALALLAGVIAGAVAAPALLPWLPGRMFALKGAITGSVAAAAVGLMLAGRASLMEMAALLPVTVAASSFLAMNFTGSTPFTSPSGVEKEMRRSLPLQVLTVLTAAGIWIATGFGA